MKKKITPEQNSANMQNKNAVSTDVNRQSAQNQGNRRAQLNHNKKK